MSESELVTAKKKNDILEQLEPVLKADLWKWWEDPGSRDRGQQVQEDEYCQEFQDGLNTTVYLKMKRESNYKAVMLSSG